MIPCPREYHAESELNTRGPSASKHENHHQKRTVLGNRREYQKTDNLEFSHAIFWNDDPAKPQSSRTANLRLSLASDAKHHGTSVSLDAVDVDVFWTFQVELLERCPLDLTSAIDERGILNHISAANLTTNSQSNVSARISVSRDRRY